MQAACTSYVRKLISASWHIFSLTLQLEIMWFLLTYLLTYIAYSKSPTQLSILRKFQV